jgi:hypothetical protein
MPGLRMGDVEDGWGLPAGLRAGGLRGRWGGIVGCWWEKGGWCWMGEVCGWGFVVDCGREKMRTWFFFFGGVSLWI